MCLFARAISGLCWLLSWNTDYRLLSSVTINYRVPLLIKCYSPQKGLADFQSSLPALFHGNSETKAFQYLKNTYFHLRTT